MEVTEKTLKHPHTLGTERVYTAIKKRLDWSFFEFLATREIVFFAILIPLPLFSISCTLSLGPFV